jgi:glycosyltransferase involved in cell wall biosynthesis
VTLRSERVRLVVVTDAWKPQTNGVVTTLVHVTDELAQLGVESRIIHPGLFRTVPLPSYPEIRIAVDLWRFARVFDAAPADTIHIATEGPLGLAARVLCARRGLGFSTSLHTKFPEYLHQRVRFPLAMGYRCLRWFHAAAAATLVTTPTHRDELAAHGFHRLVVWGRGVDTRTLHPGPRLPRCQPKLLYVGRIAPEKNLEAFLSLRLPGEKIVVGDGPARAALQARHPDVCWVGFKHGPELVAFYQDADVFVFPSRTDTFGLVMLEANACGTPVAAYPVTGPRDVVCEGVNGALDEDLSSAVERALRVDRRSCRTFAERHGWRTIAERMLESLVPLQSADAGTRSNLRSRAVHHVTRAHRSDVDGSGDSPMAAGQYPCTDAAAAARARER